MYSCTVLRFAMQLYYNDFMKCAILCIDINIAFEQNQRTLFLISCSFTRKKSTIFRPVINKEHEIGTSVNYQIDWIEYKYVSNMCFKPKHFLQRFS